jgi:hypothetical protein
MVEETGENQRYVGSLEAYIVILELTTIHSTAKQLLLPLKLDMSDRYHNLWIVPLVFSIVYKYIHVY